MIKDYRLLCNIINESGIEGSVGKLRIMPELTLDEIETIWKALDVVIANGWIAYPKKFGALYMKLDRFARII